MKIGRGTAALVLLRVLRLAAGLACADAAVDAYNEGNRLRDAGWAREASPS